MHFGRSGICLAAGLLLSSCGESGNAGNTDGPPLPGGFDAATDTPSQPIAELPPDAARETAGQPPSDAARETAGDAARDARVDLLLCTPGLSDADCSGAACNDMLASWEAYLADPAMVACVTPGDCVVVGGQPALDPCNGHSTIGYCGRAANAAAYRASPAASLETEFAAGCPGHIGFDCGPGYATCTNGKCTIAGFSACNPPPPRPEAPDARSTPNEPGREAGISEAGGGEAGTGEAGVGEAGSGETGVGEAGASETGGGEAGTGEARGG
jgi:hypothetical protein